jgi:hypothetical protein
MLFEEQHQSANKKEVNPASELCKPLLGGPGTRQSLLVDIRDISDVDSFSSRVLTSVKLF